MISANCSSCKAAFRLEDRLAGKLVRCPKCRDVFRVEPTVVPVSESEAITARPTARPVDENIRIGNPSDSRRWSADRGLRDQREVPRPVTSRRKGLLIVLIGGLLLASAGIVTLILLLPEADQPGVAQKPGDKKADAREKNKEDVTKDDVNKDGQKKEDDD